MLASSVGQPLSHWSTLIEELHTSSLDFYSLVESAIARRDIPNALVTRIDYQESGVLSARREYLRVERGEDVFDICAAPFGRGFFFSSWLAQKRPGLLASLAFVGVFLFVFVLTWAIAAVVMVGIFGEFMGAVLTFFVMIFAAPFLFGLLAEMWGPEKAVRLPVIGPVYQWIFSPPTYYSLDTAAMFQKSVQNAVMEALDELTTAQGVRALTEAERKPILRGLLER